MTTFLIPRLFQMVIAIIMSAMVSYGLMYLAPGGPLTGLRQTNQSGANRISEEDIARIRARYELDLNLPYRFTRWLIGVPRGPITIAGQEYFADKRVGCAVTERVRLR